MGKRDFEKFLRHQTEHRPASFDVEAALVFWRDQLSTLYTQVQTWLEEYVTSGQLQLSFNEHSITEELLGVYHVQAAVISLGTKQARLTPVGTILIGTRGRVDLSGPGGVAKFILADRNATGPKIIIEEYSSVAERDEQAEKRRKRTEQPIEWVWKATTPPPRITYKDLTQDVFLDCLMGVLNG